MINHIKRTRDLPVFTQAHRHAMLAVVCMFLFCGPAFSEGGGVHWSYSGHDGPGNWGGLSEEYHLCSSGINQSPINIENPLSSNLFSLEFNYGSVPLQVVNNGHTIQINYNTTVDEEKSTIVIDKKTYRLPSATSYRSSISISGEKYNLLQVHFHSPSEHYVQGASYAMEAHFVHANSAGQFAVVGVFLVEGARNSFVSKVWNNMPANTDGVHTFSDIRLNAGDLLPDNVDYYHYRGSQTIPPCSEGVRWFVMKNTREVSSSQIRKFLSIISNNARPIQPIHSRYLLGKN